MKDKVGNDVVVVSGLAYGIDITAHRDLIIPLPFQIIMAVIMAVVSLLMMSRVIYPSFKHVNFEKRGTITAILLVAAALCCFIVFPWIAPAIIFLCYLLYGLVVRPLLSRRLRRVIEVDDDEDEPKAPNAQ